VSITRTIELKDLLPAEIAELFCEMDAEQQAEFFANIQRLAAEWPGAGWCQQSHDIAKAVNPAAREVITKLAEHVLCHDELVLAVHQYRSDLKYPPAPDSVQRRLAMIDDLISRSSGDAA